MKNRIWELDAARGLAVLGMLAIHFLFDLTEISGVLSWDEPGWYLLIKNHGGFLFLAISGICATLGTRNFRRGVQVLSCGMLCTAVTYALYRIGAANASIVIYFGVLHCLGVCMMLWSVLQKLGKPALLTCALVLIVWGLAISPYAFETPWWLIPVGFCPEWFSSSDYFPLLPNLGLFLLGAYMGRVLYADKKTRFPGTHGAVSAFLCAVGRKSLLIYLLHQPALIGISMGIRALL